MAATIRTSSTVGPLSGLTAQITVTGVQAGDTIHLWVKVESDSRDISSISDDRGNNWTAIHSATIGSARCIECYAPNCAAGDTIVTITWNSSAAASVYMIATPIGGLTAASADDAIAINAASSTNTITVTSASPTTQADVLVMTCGRSSTAARPLDVPSGYTQAAALADPQMLVSYKTVASTGTQSSTHTVTGGNTGITGALSTYKIAGSGGGSSIAAISNYHRMLRSA